MSFQLCQIFSFCLGILISTFILIYYTTEMSQPLCVSARFRLMLSALGCFCGNVCTSTRVQAENKVREQYFKICQQTSSNTLKLGKHFKANSTT